MPLSGHDKWFFCFYEDSSYILVSESSIRLSGVILAFSSHFTKTSIVLCGLFEAKYFHEKGDRDFFIVGVHIYPGWLWDAAAKKCSRDDFISIFPARRY